MIKKDILQDLDGDDLTPRPYWIMTRLPSSAPPGREATLMPDPGPGEVPAAAAALLPAFPEFVEPPFWHAPIPVTVAVRRAAILACSNSGDRSLWPTLLGFSSSQTAHTLPTSPGEY